MGKWFRRGAWLLAWTGVSLLGAETGVRLAFGPRLQIIAPDPMLGWRMKRNADFRGSLHTNSSGFHDREHNSSTAKPRVVVIGDSYVAGLAMKREELLHSRLESNLGNAEVIAAASPAWSTGQQLIWWEEEGAGLGARAVVLLVAPNDIRESFANGFHRIDERGALARNSPRSISWLSQVHWFLLNHSTVANHLSDLWSTNNAFALVRRHWPFTFTTEYGTCQDEDLFRRQPAKEVLAAQEFFAQELSAFQAAVKLSGARLLVAVLPTKTEWEDPVARGSNYRPGRVAEWVNQTAKNLGIEVVDLTGPALKTLRKENLFLHDDYHFSAAGHDWVARMLTPRVNALVRP